MTSTDKMTARDRTVDEMPADIMSVDQMIFAKMFKIQCL